MRHQSQGFAITARHKSRGSCAIRPLVERRSFGRWGPECAKRGKLFYLQLKFFYLQLSFFPYSPLRCFLETLSHCKQRSSTVSQEARAVSKKAQTLSKKAPKRNCKQKKLSCKQEASNCKQKCCILKAS